MTEKFLELEVILQYIDSNGSLDSLLYSKTNGVLHQDVISALFKLDSIPGFICLKQLNQEMYVLTCEGDENRLNGSSEYRFFCSLPDDGFEQSKVKSLPKDQAIGFNKAMADKWVKIEKRDDVSYIMKAVTSPVDQTAQYLNDIYHGNVCDISEKVLGILKKRKLISKQIVKYFIASKDEKFSTKLPKVEKDLTCELLVGNEWESCTFKPYNFSAVGQKPDSGSLHPLLEMRSEFVRLFTNMGFEEMPTNCYVESSFWNFDALFQPQQHSARDAHDTFFLKDPSTSELTNVPRDYLDKVKTVHEEGGYGSIGFQNKWDINEAKKLILRTHTTAVSAKMLHKLAENQPFKPKKYFSIDRVFRNETTDATHLAEFHQIEGLVADYDLSLAHLIGMLDAFFRQLGITKLRYKPAFNPYTEPSMEVFSYHEGLKKWIEIGNSGVFRPEMLRPMGLPENVCVIAWGLSLERPTMIKYGISNIRTLFGHRVSIDKIKNSNMCLI